MSNIFLDNFYLALPYDLHSNAVAADHTFPEAGLYLIVGLF